MPDTSEDGFTVTQLQLLQQGCCSHSLPFIHVTELPDVASLFQTPTVPEVLRAHVTRMSPVRGLIEPTEMLPPPQHKTKQFKLVTPAYPASRNVRSSGALFRYVHYVGDVLDRAGMRISRKRNRRSALGGKDQLILSYAEMSVEGHKPCHGRGLLRCPCPGW